MASAQTAYLDNAATTQMDEEIIRWMSQLMRTHYGNPSSIYEPGRQAKVLVEQARTSIANLLKVTPAEIFFTSGGTESINTIIHGAIAQHGIKRIISSPIEHDAMLNSLQLHSKSNGIELLFLSVDRIGHPDLAQLKTLLENEDGGKTLVSLMHANNEIGTLLPIKKVGELCHKHHALFFSDTVQTMGKFSNDCSAGNLDFAVASAHKFHGPKGVGFMYINGNSKIQPLLIGGSQERNMRAGTENVIGISAMVKAMEIAYKNREENALHYQELKSYLMRRIENEFPTITYNGDPLGLPNLISIGIPKTSKNEMILMKMDMHGVFVSGGSACSSGALHDSHVIKAIGKVNEVRPIRLSMSKYTTQSELDYFLEVLKKV